RDGPAGQTAEPPQRLGERLVAGDGLPGAEHAQGGATTTVAMVLLPEFAPVHPVMVLDQRARLKPDLPVRLFLHAPAQVGVTAGFEARFEPPELLQYLAAVGDVGRREVRAVGTFEGHLLIEHALALREYLGRRSRRETDDLPADAAHTRFVEPSDESLQPVRVGHAVGVGEGHDLPE